MKKVIFTYISCLFCIVSFSQTGLIVNEVSQGNAGVREYVELMVIAPTGTCFVDIRNWIIDDNNGDFSGGPVASAGIASGHIRFTNDPQWQNVPTGSIILIYNSADKNTSITLPDDPSDSDNDKVYVLPVSSPLLESCTSRPAVGNATYTCTVAYSSPATWGPLGLSNDGDVMQVRTPAGAFFHGVAFGDGACNCIVGIPGGPMVDPCTAAGCSGGKVYSFTNNSGDDYTLATNYTIGTAGVNETPGTTNNAANDTWRNLLLCPLPLPAITLKSTVVGNEVSLQYQKIQDESIRNIVLEHSTVNTAWQTLSEMNYYNSYTHTLYDNEVHFYRILFQDKDGNTKISNVVSATANINQNEKLHLFPNPVKNELNLTFTQLATGYVQVFNLAGQLIYQKEIQNTAQENIPTYNWNEGMFMLRFISNKGEIFTQKFIKTND